MSTQQPPAGDCGGNAAPYVLGALTDTEHEAFLVHLAGCAVCREEVAALSAVAAALPAAAPTHRAPPQLKRQVMAEVRGDARRRAAERARLARADARGTPWRPLAARAAFAAMAVALVVALVTGGGGGGGGGGAGVGQRLIRAEVSAPGASGWLRVSGGRAELSLAHMPASPAGRVYEVWVKRAGAPIPTDALFTVTSSGTASVGVPGAVAGVRAVLVTAEPLGGSRVPTTPAIVVAHLT